jgi:uncharacterized protein (DUF1015 family)
MPTKPPLLLTPFEGVLPSRDKAHLVATRSYLSYSDYELKDKLARNPYSYLHVIHPDGDLDSSKDLASVRGAYEAFLKRGWLERDGDKNYYVQRQTGPMGTCTGVVGLVPTAEAKAGRIKVHEATLANREALFAQYLSEVGLNAEPTLLAHPFNANVDAAIRTVTDQPADFDFTTADGIRHTLWRPTHTALALLEAAFETVEHAYIADGHHRVASSMRMAEAHPDQKEAHAFMALLVSEDELMFRGFHRTVQLEDHQKCARVLQQLGQLDGALWQPGNHRTEATEGCILLRGAIVGSLHIEQALRSQGNTPAEWLQKEVLNPLFDIAEPRTDHRLKYLAGDLAQEELEATTSDESRLAFIMPPLTFAGLQKVADDGRHLPPKSTWIAPKLRSGMTLFDFGPSS